MKAEAEIYHSETERALHKRKVTLVTDQALCNRFLKKGSFSNRYLLMVVTWF